MIPLPKSRKERHDTLRQMLQERRDQELSDVQARIKDLRAETKPQLVMPDQSDVGIHEDIELALIFMKSETLQRLDAALRRLTEGIYGDCFECGDEISESRLRALPFTVRCKECDEAQETTEMKERFRTRGRKET